MTETCDNNGCEISQIYTLPKPLLNCCGESAKVDTAQPLPDNGCGFATILPLPQPKRPGQYQRKKIPYRIGDNATITNTWFGPTICEWDASDLKDENEAFSKTGWGINKIRCWYCGRIFRSKTSSPRYCSTRCKNDAYIQRRRECRRGEDL
jgi:hypothetical protein